MRSLKTSTLLAVALPIFVLGLLSFSTDRPGDRPLFLPDAAMWSRDWLSYSFLIIASLLLFFVSGRAILRAFRR